jgi:uncharacterized protein GlcG (DUF336 family)
VKQASSRVMGRSGAKPLPQGAVFIYRGRERPMSTSRNPMSRVTYAVGGVTVMAGGAATGAIGVSGAPGGQFDEECARGARQDQGPDEITSLGDRP